MNQTIDISICFDDSYSQHGTAVIASVLYNNKDLNCRFHILSDCISEQNRALIESVMASFGGDNSLEIITVDNSIFKDFGVVGQFLPVHSYYRLLLPKLLPNIDKVLYLDSDIVVDGPLAELWSTPVEGMYYAAAVDNGPDIAKHKLQIGFTPNEKYFNSGVSLLNLKEIRLHDALEPMYHLSDEQKASYRFHDQDIMNTLLKGKIVEVSGIYNFTSVDKQKDMPSRPVILHYTCIEPWTIYIKCVHELASTYFKYLKMTPYYNSFIWKFRLGRIKRRIAKWRGKSLYALNESTLN